MASDLLIDSELKALKPSEKPFSVNDGAGLSLLVSPDGKMNWRYRYRFGGKAKMLSFGFYPKVSLKKARDKRKEGEKNLDDGKDPSAVRKADKFDKQNDFKSVALRWHKAWSVGKDPKHSAKVLRRLEQNVFPEIGAMPIKDINAPMLVRMAKKVTKRGAIDIAKRSYATSSQIFRFAIVEGVCDRNPATDVNLSDAHIESPPVKHRTSLNLKEVPALLRKIDSYDADHDASIITTMAMQLMSHTFVRTTELIEARWDEFDFKDDVWTIPANRMKKVRTRPSSPHIVHLTKQTKALLQTLKKITGGGEFVFPHESNPKKSMSNNTILFALYRMGYRGKMTGHGFRSIASTALHEMGYPHAVIEAQLSHLEGDKVSKAYNHSEYLAQRSKMMDGWSNYLDAIKTGAQVIGFARASNG
jgi:integrase